MLATSSNPFDLFVSNQSSCRKFLSRASPSLADIYEEGTDFNFSCRKWNTSGIKKCLWWCPSLQVKGKEEEEEMRKVISQKRPQYILKRIYKQKYCSECFLLLQWTSPMLLSQDSFGNEEGFSRAAGISYLADILATTERWSCLSMLLSSTQEKGEAANGFLSHKSHPIYTQCC